MEFNDEDDSSKGTDEIPLDVSLITLMFRVFYFYLSLSIPAPAERVSD